SANRMVELLNAKALVVFTLTGGTARMVAAPRPMVPVFAFTSRLARARRLTLLRGALPFLMEDTQDFLADIQTLFSRLKTRKLVKKGNRLVIAAGVPPGIPQWTNVLRV
ncbi:MAG: pyruvate kinase, partial [Nitrospinaceae bacterium]|nr:pyruvate kinase [Nitrospinaceae bacterium]NIT84136.1 pyruvate kinase [Nitrospinaceae bacterium]NIU98505.1 pyruvate kinase [Nitrospinaceae bacterium]NIY17558.1 pyruvate kinase [Nitrospinaceae bacterium]